MIFHENRLLADHSHEISYLIFFKNSERCLKNLAFAVVVISALRVKNNHCKKKRYHWTVVGLPDTIN